MDPLISEPHITTQAFFPCSRKSCTHRQGMYATCWRSLRVLHRNLCMGRCWSRLVVRAPQWRKENARPGWDFRKGRRLTVFSFLSTPLQLRVGCVSQSRLTYTIPCFPKFVTSPYLNPAHKWIWFYWHCSSLYPNWPIGEFKHLCKINLRPRVSARMNRRTSYVWFPMKLFFLGAVYTNTHELKNNQTSMPQERTSFKLITMSTSVSTRGKICTTCDGWGPGHLNCVLDVVSSQTIVDNFGSDWFLRTTRKFKDASRQFE